MGTNQRQNKPKKSVAGDDFERYKPRPARKNPQLSCPARPDMHHRHPHHRLAWRLAFAGLAMAFSVAPPALAGAADGNTGGIAEREIARRNDLARQATSEMQRGNQARKEKDFATAVEAYQQVVQVLPDSPVNASLRAHGLRAFSETSVARAEELAMQARYDEANATLDLVLQPGWNPEYRPALRLKEQIQDPERYNPAATPKGIEKVQEVTKLLTLAQGHHDLGEFAKAQEAFNRVLAIDPYNTAARRGLERADRAISEYALAARDHTRADALRHVDAQWETPVPARPGIDFGPTGPETDRGGFAVGIRAKLKTIIFPSVQLVDATMDEVVQFLVLQSKNYDTLEPDPGRKGINIVLGGDATLAAKRITLSLTDVPIEYVLEMVARQAGTDYQVDDYLVTFGPAGAVPMTSRSFRVPPGFFTSAPATTGVGLEQDPFATRAADASSSSPLAFAVVDPKSFLGQSGVTFPEGASVHYSRVTGIMTVRNTNRNLELVQTLVDQAGTSVQKMVRIMVTMLEVFQENIEELGFDWLLGPFDVGGRVFATGGTSGNQPSDSQSLSQNFPMTPPGAGERPVGQNPVTAGNRSGNSAIPEQTLEALLRTGTRSPNLAIKAPAVFGLSGVFTDPQFQVVMRALNQKRGLDLAASPSVLVKSGQRAKLQIIREFPYPTEFEPPEIPQDFGGSNFNILGPVPNIQQTNSAIPITPTTPTSFEFKNLGHALEVEATVGADNRTIDIDVAPAFSEFEGFINYGSPILSYPNGTTPVVLTENRIPQPVFRTNKTEGGIKVTLWSGGAMVISGLASDEQTTVEDKTPIFGDLPFFGRMFRSKAMKNRQKVLVFLLKADVVDPSGEVPPVGDTVAAQN
jgi:general secretion pathway protein D